jgi:DHA1 family tetracycline resistance protein-like MFS transporter
MNLRLALILFTVALDTAGMGLIMPVLPKLLRELSGSNAITAPYGLMLSLYALMQFVFSPILGALSDRYGRRPVLLMSLAGAAIDYLVMASSTTLTMLFVGRAIAGITGANAAVATAYIADISDESQRAKRYGWLNACFGIGFVAGPMLGGLLGEWSPRYPFVASAILNGLNFAMALFVLPESHTGERRKLSLSGLNPLAAFGRVAGMRTLLPMISIYFLLFLIGQLPGTLWVIYGEDHFGWDAHITGITLAGFGIAHAATQAFVTGPVTAKLGERRAIIVGMICDGSAYAAMAFLTQTWMVFALMPLFAAGGLAMPALQALISSRVDENRQGELQGTLVSLVSLSAIGGPLAATAAYAAASPNHTGIVWIGGAALYLLAIPLLWRWR